MPEMLPLQYLVHGALMVLAWGFLMPIGALIARFYKVTVGQDYPRQLDNQFWWRWHRWLQYSAVMALSIALYLVWVPGQWPGSLHGRLGLALCVVACLQVFSAWLRGSKGGPTDKQMRGDHFDMTLRRRLFEHWHKTFGWTSMVLAGLVIFGGLRQGGLSAGWALSLLAVLWSLYMVCFVRLTLKGRRVNTWAAIWGPATPRSRPAETRSKEIS